MDNPFGGQDHPPGRHPLRGELYTPITPEILELLETLHRKYGTWLVVAYHAKTRARHLREIRHRRQAITMKLLDRIITETGIGRLEDYEWFTADDLVLLGLWKPPVTVEGRNRIQGNQRWVRPPGRLRKNKHT